MYGELGHAPSQEAPAESMLAQMAIENIPDREGQYLRNALMDRFYRHGRPSAPSFSLKIDKIQERRIDLDITRESEATRAEVRLETTLRLYGRDKEVLLDRPLASAVSYDILSSQFTTRVTREDAREAALDDLARQIELQLSLYFNR